MRANPEGLGLALDQERKLLVCLFQLRHGTSKLLIGPPQPLLVAVPELRLLTVFVDCARSSSTVTALADGCFKEATWAEGPEIVEHLLEAFLGRVSLTIGTPFPSLSVASRFDDVAVDGTLGPAKACFGASSLSLSPLCLSGNRRGRGARQSCARSRVWCIIVTVRSRFFLSSQTHSYPSSVFFSFEKAALQYRISMWVLKSFCHAAIRHSVVSLLRLGAPHSGQATPACVWRVP